MRFPEGASLTVRVRTQENVFNLAFLLIDLFDSLSIVLLRLQRLLGLDNIHAVIREVLLFALGRVAAHRHVAFA
mgnify:CR=1 FL=1